MRKERFFKEMEETFAKMLETSKRKNGDYCGGDDAFANFRQVENLGVCTAEEAILVRMSDKMSRAANLIKANRTPLVLDEAVEDTLIDLANYAVILALYIRDENHSVERG